MEEITIGRRRALDALGNTTVRSHVCVRRVEKRRQVQHDDMQLHTARQFSMQQRKDAPVHAQDLGTYGRTVLWCFLCIMLLISEVAWCQNSEKSGCPDKVSVGALTGLVANDEILTEVESDIQLLVDCLEDGEVLFLNTTSIIQPKSTIMLDKRVTVSGMDPVIERRLVRNANKGVGDVPAGRTGARITCPEDKELFIMSNKAKIANLVIQECVVESASLDFESNLFATNIVTSAPVVVRDCRGSSEAGVFFSSFRNNTNREQSASILVSDGCTVDVDQVEFVSNAGLVSAMAVYGEAKISEGSFSFNGFLEPESPLSMVGGAILCSRGLVSIQNSEFSDNQGWNGGSITASGCDLTIEGSTFANNTSLQYGGGVSASGEPCNVTISLSSFKDNSARAGGGGVSCSVGSDVRISQCAFTRNMGSLGGAIQSLNCEASTSALSIDVAGVAEELGNGNLNFLCNVGQSMEMNNVTFMENTATDAGGALVVELHWNVVGKNLVFEQNQAPQGGAIRMLGNGVAKFEAVDFLGNSATTGGAVHMMDSNFDFTGVKFWDNSADGGGGLYAEAQLGMDLSLTFTGGEFRGNSAHISAGGGLFLPMGGYSVFVTNTTFVSNKAISGGGIGIFGTKSNTQFPIVMENVLATANVGETLGGGFFHGAFLNVKMKNCTVLENMSEGFGGAMFLPQLDRLEMIDCNFLRNSAEPGSGGNFVQLPQLLHASGAIHIEQSQVNLNDLAGQLLMRNCLFEGNSANGSHGAVSITDAKAIRVENCTFRESSGSSLSAAFAVIFRAVQKPSFIMLDCEFIRNRLPHLFGASLFLGYPKKCDCPKHLIERTTFRENGLALRIFPSTTPEFDLGDLNADTSKDGGNRSSFVQNFNENPMGTPRTTTLGQSKFQFLMKDVRFLNNTRGIQVFFPFFPIKIKDSWFEGNSVLEADDLLNSKQAVDFDSLGVAIHLSNPRAEVNNCTFLENHVVRAAIGGAIAVDAFTKGGEFSCSGCAFMKNLAASGGAVALNLFEKTDIRFANTTFEFNQAFIGIGGGLYSRHGFEDSVQFDCTNYSTASNISEAEKNWVPMSRISEQKEMCPGLTWNSNSAFLWGGDMGGPAEFVKVNTTFVPKHKSQSVLPPIIVQIVDGSGSSTGNALQSVVGNMALFDPDVQKATQVGISFRPLVRVSVVTATGSVNGQIFDRMTERSELVLSGLEVSAPVTGKPVNVTLQIDAQLTEGLALLFGLPSKSEDSRVNPALVVVEVEGCRVGELSVGDTCSECQAGTFSTSSNQQFCNPCPSGGVCRMGVLVPQAQYWIMDPWGHDVVKCRSNEACQTELSLLQNVASREEALLDFHRANPVANDEFPSENFTICSPGYEGVLCGSCSKGFGRGGVQCRKCGSKEKTALLVVLLQALPIVIVVVLTILAIKKIDAEEDDDSLLSPSMATIISNYMQLTSTVLLLQVELPVELDTLFSTQGSMVNVAPRGPPFISFDSMECLMDGNSVPRSLQRVIIESLFPFMVALVACLLWLLLACPLKISMERLKLYMLITIFNVFNTLYTSANAGILSLFNCFDISTTSELGSIQGKFWIEDSNVRCYRGNHLVAVILVGVVGMLLVSFGVPVLVVTFLWFQRAELFSREHEKKYGFLYATFKPKFYFWASVITLRRALAVIVVVFTGGFGPQLQTQLFGFVLSITLLLQLAIQPYQNQKLNLMETGSLFVSWVTLFFGMYIFGGEGRIVRVSTLTRDILKWFVLIINVALLLWFAFELRLGALDDARKIEPRKKLMNLGKKAMNLLGAGTKKAKDSWEKMKKLVFDDQNQSRWYMF